MLRVENVRKSFGSKSVLKGVDFSVPPRTLVGLIGPSGGGKSLLLKILGQVSSSYQGSIDFGDCICAQDAFAQPKSALSLMFQEGALFDSLSVFDNVAFPLVDGRVPAVNLPREIRDQIAPQVYSILGRVGLTKAAQKMPGQISGGMRRRVSLARALVSKPQVMLLDDPTSGLDPVASSVIMDLIVELHKEYQPTTIIVSHDLRRLLPVVQSVLALFDGRIVFSGPLEALRAESIKESYPALVNFVSCRYDIAS